MTVEKDNKITTSYSDEPIAEPIKVPGVLKPAVKLADALTRLFDEDPYEKPPGYGWREGEDTPPRLTDKKPIIVSKRPGEVRIDPHKQS